MPVIEDPSAIAKILGYQPVRRQDNLRAIGTFTIQFDIKS